MSRQSVNLCVDDGAGWTTQTEMEVMWVGFYIGNGPCKSIKEDTVLSRKKKATGCILDPCDQAWKPLCFDANFVSF